MTKEYNYLISLGSFFLLLLYANNPIGIFDSGVGGITILNSIKEIMPNEDIIYFSDNLNSPYGQKSEEEIKNLSKKNSNWLLDRGCKIIVVACNTATTNSISFLRANLNVPFIGVEPAIKPAATNTKTGSIGVLATKGTLSSGLFNMTSNDYCSEINIIETVGEGLVDLIENGIFKGKKLEVLLYKFLKPMLNANIDHLVLGCTHYPLIIESIKKIIPNNIKILDSGAAVAKQTKNILSQRSLLNNKKESNSEFYCNSTNTTLKKILGTKYQIETI